MTQDLNDTFDIKIGDEFRYISDIADHSFEFIIIGMKDDKLTIIVNKDKPNVSLHTINRNQIKKCIKLNA